jgi:hypothetical protein
MPQSHADAAFRSSSASAYRPLNRATRFSIHAVCSLAQVGRLAGAADVVLQVGRVQRAARDSVQVLLHALQRDRRHRAQGGDESRRGGTQAFSGFERGEKPDGPHLFCTGALVRQEQAFRVVQADPADISLQAERVVMQAQPRRRHKPVDATCADAEITGRREVGGALVDAALQPRQGQRPRVFPCLDPPLPALACVRHARRLIRSKSGLGPALAASAPLRSGWPGQAGASPFAPSRADPRAWLGRVNCLETAPYVCP